MRECLLLIIVIFLFKVSVVVEGLYQLEVRLYGYNNPTGRCEGCTRTDGSRGCCDNFALNTCTGSLRCDSFFNFCLQALGSGETQCSYNGSRTSSFNMDDSMMINFSESMVLGLENPVILPGLTEDYHGVQLHIELIDDDSASRIINNMTNNDDLVDTFQIPHNLSVGQQSLRQNYSGIFGFATMDLATTVTCVENFQGSDCTRCEARFSGAQCEIKANSKSNTGAIAGGVIGVALSLLVVLLVVIVTVILVVRYRKHQLCFKGKIGNYTKNDTPKVDSTARAHYVSAAAVDTEQHIYGNGGFHADKEGPADHEFDNPIYCTEDEYMSPAEQALDSTAHHVVTQHYQNLDTDHSHSVYANFAGSGIDTQPNTYNGQIYGNVDTGEFS